MSEWEFNDNRWITIEDLTVENENREFGLSRKKVVAALVALEIAFCEW